MSVLLIVIIALALLGLSVLGLRMALRELNRHGRS